MSIRWQPKSWNEKPNRNGFSSKFDTRYVHTECYKTFSLSVSLITFNNLIIFIFMPVHKIESFSLRWICKRLVIMLEMLFLPLDIQFVSFFFWDVKDEWWITLHRMIWESIAEPPYPICHQWHYRHRAFVGIVLIISVRCCCFCYFCIDRNRYQNITLLTDALFHYGIRFVRFSCSEKLTIHIIHHQTAK